MGVESPVEQQWNGSTIWSRTVSRMGRIILTIYLHATDDSTSILLIIPSACRIISRKQVEWK